MHSIPNSKFTIHWLQKFDLHFCRTQSKIYKAAESRIEGQLKQEKLPRVPILPVKRCHHMWPRKQRLFSVPMGVRKGTKI